MGKNQVTIVTDTSACIPPELVKHLEIEIVAVLFGFGKESFHDGIDMTTHFAD
jgi:fatty acid-binding protein DegV